MDTQTLKRLEAAGFVPTTVAEFLGLSPAEEALVETKVQFTIWLKQVRAQRGLTQAQLAKLLQTTQQTVARAERGGDGVSLDFLLRALVTLELSLSDIADELRDLDAKLHPAKAACAEASACEQTEPMSAGELHILPREKDDLIASQKVAAASRPTSPMLQLIRGGFGKGSGSTGKSRRRLPQPECETADFPFAATG